MLSATFFGLLPVQCVCVCVCLRPGLQLAHALLVQLGLPLVLQGLLQPVVHVLQLPDALQVLLQLTGFLSHLLLHLLTHLMESTHTHTDAVARSYTLDS